MDDLFSTVQRHIKQRAVTGFLTHKNKTPLRIHQQLLAFYGNDTVAVSTVQHWVRKGRDICGNLDQNDQLWSGRPVIAAHDLNRQKF
jgi:hypothetical protein